MKKYWIVFLTFCFFFLLTTPVYAYLDPSVMTYTIQAVVGVVIAIGAFIGMYWRKAKKKAQQALNIDEHAKKEFEEDVIEIYPDEKQ